MKDPGNEVGPLRLYECSGTKLQSTTNVRCDFVMTFNKICLTFTIAAPKEYSSTWRRFILPLHLRYRKVREFFENF